jgi:hypothetical protein
MHVIFQLTSGSVTKTYLTSRAFDLHIHRRCCSLHGCVLKVVNTFFPTCRSSYITSYNYHKCKTKKSLVIGHEVHTCRVVQSLAFASRVWFTVGRRHSSIRWVSDSAPCPAIYHHLKAARLGGNGGRFAGKTTKSFKEIKLIFIHIKADLI